MLFQDTTKGEWTQATLRRILASLSKNEDLCDRHEPDGSIQAPKDEICF
jgi:hypothetical protein